MIQFIHYFLLHIPQKFPYYIFQIVSFNNASKFLAINTLFMQQSIIELLNQQYLIFFQNATHNDSKYLLYVNVHTFLFICFGGISNKGNSVSKDINNL